MKLNGMDSESSATASFYFGLIGAGLSLIGVILSVYSLVTGEKAFWLGLSGWLAATLVAIALTKLCINLININAALNKELNNQTYKSTLLSEKNDQLSQTNQKLIEIDAYVISKTVRKPVPRKERSETQTTPAAQQPNDGQEEEA